LDFGAVVAATTAPFPLAGAGEATVGLGVAVEGEAEVSGAAALFAGEEAGLGAASVTGAGRSAGRLSVRGIWSSPQPARVSGATTRASSKGENIRTEQKIRGDFTEYSFEAWLGAGKLRP